MTNDQINLHLNLPDIFSGDIVEQKEKLWQQFHYLLQYGSKHQLIKGKTLQLSITLNSEHKGLKLKIDKMYQLVKYEKIIRVEANVNYTLFYTMLKDQPVLTCKTLKYYTDNLLKHGFIKAHRAHIVNPLFIKNYCARSNKLYINDGSVVNVARRRKNILSTHLKERFF